MTVHEVARQCWAAAATTCQGLASPTFVSINCMSLQQPSAIFRRALEAFQQGQASARDPIIYSGKRTPPPSKSLSSRRIDSGNKELARPCHRMRSAKCAPDTRDAESWLLGSL